jgi:hypothetical protein
MLGIETDADAGAQEEAVIEHLERELEQIQDLARHGRGILVVPDVVEDDGELVAAHARDGVVLAKESAQSLGDRRQYPVAIAVIETVVDLLEAVEVDEEHGEPAPMAMRRMDGLTETVGEQQPVGQAGERVVLGEMGIAQFALAQLVEQGEMFADVARDLDDGAHLAGLVEQRAGRDLVLTQCAVRGAIVPDELTGLACIPDGAQRTGMIVLVAGALAGGGELVTGGAMVDEP